MHFEIALNYFFNGNYNGKCKFNFLFNVKKILP